MSEARLNFQATNDLQAVLLAVFIAALLGSKWLRRFEPWRLAALAVLSAGSVIAYLNLFQFHTGLGVAHPYEFYHYYVGTKYFGELGYTGLYEATVIADLEDDPGGFDGRRNILNQRSYEYESRDRVAQRTSEIKQQFSALRWQEFKADIGYFRSRAPALWRSSRVQLDHGYNGTPLTTFLLGNLAALAPLRAGTFVAWAAWLDAVLILATALWIAALAGPGAGLLFVFLWAVNPFNAYGYIGGAYLRHLYLAAFAAAVVCFGRGRAVASGALAALSAGLAIFPCLPVAALFARDLLHAERAREFRAHSRFYVAFGATVALLGAVTSVGAAPGRVTPWLEFRDALSVHAGVLSPNHVGLASVLAFDPGHDLRSIETGTDRDWVSESRATLDSRSLGLRVLQAGFLLGLFWFLRGASAREAWFGGVVAIYAFVPLSHYYYALLCVVPFMLGLERRTLVLLAGFWGVVTGLRQFEGLDEVLDRLMFAVSCGAGLYVAAALVDSMRARRLDAGR